MQRLFSYARCISSASLILSDLQQVGPLLGLVLERQEKKHTDVSHHVYFSEGGFYLNAPRDD